MAFTKIKSCIIKNTYGINYELKNDNDDAVVPAIRL